MEWEDPGDAGVKFVKKESEAVGQRLQSKSDQTSAPRVFCETRATMSTPEEQMAMAVQQSYVQFQETLTTILQAYRNELVERLKIPRLPPHRDSPELSTQ